MARAEPNRQRKPESDPMEFLADTWILWLVITIVTLVVMSGWDLQASAAASSRARNLHMTPMIRRPAGPYSRALRTARVGPMAAHPSRIQERPSPAPSQGREAGRSIGRRIENRAPSPTALATSSRPPWRWTMV